MGIDLGIGIGIGIGRSTSIRRSIGICMKQYSIV